MTGEQMLQHVAGIIAERGADYGDAATAMATVAARRSITLGHPVTPAQVVLCMIDLKLARLAYDPKHQDSTADVIGYAALLPEVMRRARVSGAMAASSSQHATAAGCRV